MKNKFNMRKIICLLLIAVFSGVAVFSAVNIWKNIYEANKSKESFSKVSELVVQKEEQEPEQKKQTPADVYKDVYEKNNDFIGWLKIDGTKIDYPVMYTPDKRDYYLRRGFDGEYSYYGTPYVSERCDVKTSQNVIIYGHNMNNGTMFYDLEKYSSKDFYKNHKYITFDTLDGFGKYEIVAVFKTVVYSESEFKYFRFADGTEQEFNEYVKTCKDLSFYDTGVEVKYGDRLITLSTCEYSQKHGRLAVVAKKVE